MAPKIDPGGLSEAAGAARSTQEQQRTTKKRPRATQERPKSGGKRFSRFSRPRILVPPGACKHQDRVLEGVGSQNTVFVWKVLQFSCFSEVLEKMAPPKLKLKL